MENFRNALLNTGKLGRLSPVFSFSGNYCGTFPKISLLLISVSQHVLFIYAALSK